MTYPFHEAAAPRPEAHLFEFGDRSGRCACHGEVQPESRPVLEGNVGPAATVAERKALHVLFSSLAPETRQFPVHLAGRAAHVWRQELREEQAAAWKYTAELNRARAQERKKNARRRAIAKAIDELSREEPA